MEKKKNSLTKVKTSRNRDKNVQSTNDSSIVSKLSAVNKGYFSDDFIEYFVDCEKKRSPIINRGYYVRFKAIETAFDSFFRILRELGASDYQIFSLGAGFDTTYFRMRSKNQLPGNCKFIEVDFPEVLLHKVSVMKQHKIFHELVGDSLYTAGSDGSDSVLILNSENYVLLGCDMNNVGRLYISCIKYIDLDYSLPTLFLSECSMTYMDVIRSYAVIRWAKSHFVNAVFVTYEQIWPGDAFGMIMQQHFSTLGCPLKAINTYPHEFAQLNRFFGMGWKNFCIKNMNQIYEMIPYPEQERIKYLEQFDEFETWHLKCAHYVLIWASQGSVSIDPHHNYIEFAPLTLSYYGLYTANIEVIDACLSLHRYGHRISCCGNRTIFVTGGFGDFNGKHRRIKGVVSYNIDTHVVKNVTVESGEDELGERMYHSMIFLKDNVLFIFGGRSSPHNVYNSSVVLYVNHDTSTYESKIKCKVVKCRGCIPPACFRHTMSVFTMKGKQYVFLFGGIHQDGSLQDSTYLLNTSTWHWVEIVKPATLEESLPFGYISCSAASSGCKIFVSGGLSANETETNDVFCFKADLCSWEKLNIEGLLPRYSHTSHVWKNYLVLVGGVNRISGYNPFVALIDLITYSALEFVSPEENPEYPLMTCSHDSIISEDKIIIIGGGGHCFSFGNYFTPKIVSIDLQLVEKTFMEYELMKMTYELSID